LIHRHPHVFGDVDVEGSDEVLVNWERLKAEEIGGRTVVDEGIPASLPALARASKVQRRAASSGFDLLDAEGAMEAAREAETEIRRGSYRGPLHGIPIALKDLYYTAGIRTTAGSKILADFVPAYDATVVSRLRDAGMVLLGKLNMHEFAAGGTNANPHYGAAHNPWNLDYIPGGSSGGSAAALAAGMCLGSTGSDTAGSIRMPSHCCGTTGIKPTYGRVSCYGLVPLSWSLDHAGPMTRSAHDAALMLNVMAGYDRRDSASVDRPRWTMYPSRVNGNSILESPAAAELSWSVSEGSPESSKGVMGSRHTWPGSSRRE